ncbi:MAG: DUF5996 family protein [Bacteroidota bacterium]|nr:DUF5996 family protein [Bacteroidota bacterium]
MISKKELWQPLPWTEWRETAITLHLFTQIIGKIRLALMPMQVQWAQVPFTVTSRGLASIGMPVEFGSLDIAFDFIEHRIHFNASDGRSVSFSLENHSAAGFYKEVMQILNELDVRININPMSVEMQTAIKMDTDEEHKTYDGNFVRQWWHLLVLVSNVFNKFRSRFSGKESPVNFFWGSFDLAITFFSGKNVEPKPEFDLIYRVAMDAEQTTFGFWCGNDSAPEPVFFAYTYPKPEGLENEKVNPAPAHWSVEKGEFILPYEAVRKENDPEKTLLEFCVSTYKAGTKLAGWDIPTLEHKPPIEKPEVKK